MSFKIFLFLILVAVSTYTFIQYAPQDIQEGLANLLLGIREKLSSQEESLDLPKDPYQRQAILIEEMEEKMEEIGRLVEPFLEDKDVEESVVDIAPTEIKGNKKLPQIIKERLTEEKKEQIQELFDYSQSLLEELKKTTQEITIQSIAAPVCPCGE